MICPSWKYINSFFYALAMFTVYDTVRISPEVIPFCALNLTAESIVPIVLDLALAEERKHP